MVTYGSYLPKKSNLRTSGISVAIFDTGIALLAGFMIFPALFALGKDPAEGPPLIFVVLPEVFSEMPLGTLVGVVFFVLLSIAALTSTVSLLEVVTSFFVDERRWSRSKAVWAIGGTAFVVGLPSVYSQGAVEFLGEIELFGQGSYLYIMDFLWGNISLAVGALLLSIFVGWVWGVKAAGDELYADGQCSSTCLRLWGFFLRWICPIVIFIVMLNLFGVV
jgi:NSS family neurotransmitter:Na+ symporter